MDQLPSEILLPVFKQLTSIEMVIVLRVCKARYEVIDENKALWRRLVLPKREPGWDSSIAELFDRKSCSSLQEISMQVMWKLKDDSKEMELLMEALERSQETLQVVQLLSYLQTH